MAAAFVALPMVVAEFMRLFTTLAPAALVIAVGLNALLGKQRKHAVVAANVLAKTVDYADSSLEAFAGVFPW